MSNVQTCWVVHSSSHRIEKHKFENVILARVVDEEEREEIVRRNVRLLRHQLHQEQRLNQRVAARRSSPSRRAFVEFGVKSRHAGSLQHELAIIVQTVEFVARHSHGGVSEGVHCLVHLLRVNLHCENYLRIIMDRRRVKLNLEHVDFDSRF